MTTRTDLFARLRGVSTLRALGSCLAACALGLVMIGPPTGPPASPRADKGATPDTLLSAPLEAPEANMLPAGGTLVITTSEAPGLVTLDAEGHGLDPGKHAWHVHQGPCGESGKIVIPLSATTRMKGLAGPLEVDDTGHFHARVEIGELVRSDVGARQHSLHIHQDDGAAPGPTMLCATI